MVKKRGRPSLGTTPIQAARMRADVSQEDLAAAVGLSVSQISRFETGARIPRATDLQAIAAHLGVDPASLLGPVRKRRRQIPLVGHVGAGSEALLYSAGQGPFDEVDAPDGSTDATVAVEVRGESLGALFDRWLVFYDDVRDPPGSKEIGKLCVVGLTDGRVLVKKLVRGQLPGLFTLLSNVEPPIYDVAVEWAARVTTMQPR